MRAFHWTFLLIKSKEQSEYTKDHTKIRELISQYKLEKTFSTDFELGLINAVKDVFLDQIYKGCNYQFSKALLAHLQDNCRLSPQYKSDSGFRNAFRKLLNLVLFPVDTVYGAYCRIKEQLLRFLFF